MTESISRCDFSQERREVSAILSRKRGKGMPSVFWYWALTTIGVGMIVFTWVKKKSISTISLVSFLMMSFLTVSEFSVLTVFSGYAYKPEVFPDPFADSVMGYLLGNLLLWAGAANLVVNFSLGNRWIFLLAGIFMLVETLFLDLGIYKHYWWRTYMTGIAVIIGFNITKIWVSKLTEKSYNLLRYMTLYLLALLFIHVPTHLLLLVGKQHYSIGWVENFYRDSILFGLPYHAVMAFVYVFFCCVLQKWGWKFAPVLFFLLSDFILVNMKILIFQDQWNLFYLTVFRTMSLVIFVLYKKYVCLELRGFGDFSSGLGKKLQKK